MTTFSVYILAFLYYLWQVKKVKPRIIFKKVFLFFIFIVPILFYQSLIYYFSMVQEFDAFKVVGAWSALSSPLHLLFQLRGSWWEYGGSGGVPYNIWLNFYDSPMIIISSFAIVIIALSGFVKYKLEKKSSLLFWSIFFLIAIFFAKGITPPCGFIYHWLFKNFPGFYIFREPWAKFTPLVVLTLSTMLVISLTIHKRKLLVLIVLMLLLIKSGPFFHYDFGVHINKEWKYVDLNPPDYWYKMKEWSDDNQNLSLFILPIVDENNRGYFYYYNWYNGVGNALIPFFGIFLYTNNISNSSSVFSNVGKIVKMIKNDDELKILSLFNIDYFLDQRDVDIKGKEITVCIDSLRKNNFIKDKPYKSFGKLHIYKISDEYSLPRIYSSAISMDSI